MFTGVGADNAKRIIRYSENGIDKIVDSSSFKYENGDEFTIKKETIPNEF